MIATLRQTFRAFAKSPGFVVVVVLTLAFGIGANTAIFSLFDQVMLRLLPVERPEELVIIDSPGRRGAGLSMSDNNHTVHSFPMYEDIKHRATGFRGVIGRSGAAVALGYGGQTERADAELVSGDFFDVLGVRPAFGRVLHASDDEVEGGHPVAVLTHGFWTSRFGARPDIVGQTITINGHPMVVAGVAPPGFHGVLGGRAPDLFVSLAMRRQVRPSLYQPSMSSRRQVNWLTVIARLEPGMTAARAEVALRPVMRAILEDELAELGSRAPRSREEYLDRKVELVPAPQGVNDLSDRLRTPLFSMMALVGVVLLIACVNIAGLLLARAAGRSRDVAIRLALGAGRWALIRQLLAESLILALAGGAAGLVVASWSMRFLATFAPENIARLLDPVLDSRILLFNFALATLTGIVFGLWPAFQATRASVIDALKDQSAGGGESRRHVRMRAGSVVVQVALSTLLLVAGGLFARSVYNLKSLDPGFQVENLLTFSLDPELNGYARERGHALFGDVLRSLKLLPGVQGATAGAIPVLGDSTMSGNITVEGYQPGEDEFVGSSRNFITADYFATMGIPLVRGREFNEQDRDGRPKVAIVNQAFVDRYFKDGDPLGRKMTFGSGTVTLDTEIVGVVKNQKSAELKENTQIFTYTPVTQQEGLPAMTFYLRTASDDSSLGPAVRKVVREMDANIPVEEIRTVTIVRDESIAVDRMFATLSIAFAAVATLLAAIGLYGLLAYSVARRTREIGVRMALGALRRDVFRLVLGDAFRYVALGLLLGVGGAFVLARYLESQLFGLKATDPLTFAGAAVVLLAAALLAAMLPARRAAGVQPIQALRQE